MLSFPCRDGVCAVRAMDEACQGVRPTIRYHDQSILRSLFHPDRTFSTRRGAARRGAVPGLLPPSDSRRRPTGKRGKSELGIEARRAALARFAEAERLAIAGEYVEVETGKGSDAIERRPQLGAALGG